MPAERGPGAAGRGSSRRLPGGAGRSNRSRTASRLEGEVVALAQRLPRVGLGRARRAPRRCSPVRRCRSGRSSVAKTRSRSALRPGVRVAQDPGERGRELRVQPRRRARRRRSWRRGAIALAHEGVGPLRRATRWRATGVSIGAMPGEVPLRRRRRTGPRGRRSARRRTAPRPSARSAISRAVGRSSPSVSRSSRASAIASRVLAERGRAAVDARPRPVVGRARTSTGWAPVHEGAMYGWCTTCARSVGKSPRLHGGTRQ